MKNKLTIAINKATICYEPFPHIVIPNFLPVDAFEIIRNTFPPVEKFPNTGKECDRISANYILKNITEFSYPIYELCALFNSSGLVNTLLKKFLLEKIKPKQLGVRALNNKIEYQSDFQLCINRPEHASSKRYLVEPHIDNPIEIYAGLLYLTQPSEYTYGGNVTLYSIVNGSKDIFYGKNRVKEDCVFESKQIWVEPNTFILFPNTRSSIHAVTGFDIPYTRKYINVILEKV